MMKRLTTLALAAGMFLGAAALQAQECPTSTSKCGTKKACCPSKSGANQLSKLSTVTKEQLAQMISNGQVVVVDARDANTYAAGHIEGAINFVAASLPADKNAKLVFYCGGARCPLSHQAAKKALDQGYKNVMVYSGGWSDWNKNS